MKRAIAVALTVLCLGAALANELYQISVPDEYTGREAEAYREGYAAGYYAAQHGAIEERHPENDANHYVLNIKSKRFHYPSCNGVQSMNEKNKRDFYGTREEAIAEGYEPCGMCDP